MECPECCAEHDAREAADAAMDAAEEMRKQTRLMQSGAKKVRQDSVGGTAEDVALQRSHQAQQKAQFAETRSGMDDLLGAVQLINEAIHLQPTFISFHLQRATYLAQLGRKEAALNDVRHSIEQDPTVLPALERQIRSDKPNRYQALMPEIEALMGELKDEARRSAEQIRAKVDEQVKKVRREFASGTVPDTVDSVERGYAELMAALDSESYPDLIRAPSLADSTLEDARAAIALKDDAKKKARSAISGAERVLREIAVQPSLELGNDKTNALQEAESQLGEARNLYHTESYSGYLECTRIAKRVVRTAGRVERRMRQALEMRRAPLRAKLSRRARDIAQREQAIADTYNNKIKDEEELLREHEQSASKYDVTRPHLGCGWYFLLLFCGISMSAAVGRTWNVLLWVLFGFVTWLGIWVFRCYAKSAAQSAKKAATKRIDSLRAERDTSIQSFIEESLGDQETLELKEQLRELGESL
jgi:tetratricopeptide (TPR) repeat protein